MFFLYIFAITVSTISWWLYSRSQAQVPRLYGKPSKLKTALLENSTLLKAAYHPPFWIAWGTGTLHTIARPFIKTSPQLPFEREILKLADNGQVALDWLQPANGGDGRKAPLVLILPGLTGCSSENYVLHLAKTASTEGYMTVVFNNRGNGGVELLTPKIYSAAYTDDLQAVLRHVHQRYPGSAVMAVGFSLGGMILFNYISKFEAAECGLKAAMVVNSPWDAMAATRSLEQPFNRFVFNYRLAKNLCRSIERNRKLLEEKFQVDYVLTSKLVREFDERCIVPMFNYKDVREYYQDGSFYYKINSAAVPTLCLNAADDCFAPISSIPLEAVQRSDNVLAVITSHGGHLGFMKEESPTNGGFIEDLFSHFAKIAFNSL